MRQSKKHCVFFRTNDILTFSLVDYRNNYFISDDPNKIIEVYNGFDNSDELIQWLKERPKGVANIHEVEGDKDIIVVIPTADFNGKYARECRDNIFKGLHIIFVESGEVPDPYFNYAHNCNVGIKKAMEYSPKWIIVSNDDMYKIDDVDVLTRELSSINHDVIMSVFAVPSRYHSLDAFIGRRRLFLTEIASYLFFLKVKKLPYWKIKRRIQKKYNYAISWRHGVGSSSLPRILRRRSYFFKLTSSFAILSSNFCKNRIDIFNETYVNGYEDWELSLELSRLKWTSINYRIGDYIGTSMGIGLRRDSRDLANLFYLDKRVDEILSTKG